MKRARRDAVRGDFCIGCPRPSLPVSVFAEDFSLLVRTPRRLRVARSKIRVLS